MDNFGKVYCEDYIFFNVYGEYLLRLFCTKFPVTIYWIFLWKIIANIYWDFVFFGTFVVDIYWEFLWGITGKSTVHVWNWDLSWF